MSAGEMIHASAVSADGRGLLIFGPSGSGKSTLALEMIALGAGLVADDQVRISGEEGALLAGPKDAGAGFGLIEARGVGLLRLPLAGEVPLGLVIDLGEEEKERLPFLRFWRGIRLLLRPPYLSASTLMMALRSGGPLDPEEVSLAPCVRHS